MGLLDGLTDPTRRWPVVEGPAPAVNPALMQLEAIRFGDPLDSARFLGRPDGVEWISRMRKDYDLIYARKGLRVRFKHGLLAEIEFYIGPRSCEHPAFSAARPKAPDGTTLTPEIDKKRIVQLFGEPDPKGSDDEVLQVFHTNVISDFFVDETGHLESWALYPND
jgi:hypothetical protein